MSKMHEKIRLHIGRVSNPDGLRRDLREVIKKHAAAGAPPEGIAMVMLDVACQELVEAGVITRDLPPGLDDLIRAFGRPQTAQA